MRLIEHQSRDGQELSKSSTHLFRLEGADIRAVNQLHIFCTTSSAIFRKNTAANPENTDLA
jgi:hypothetical protein